MRNRLGLLVSILFGVGLFVSIGVWAGENYNTGGRWVSTGSVTIPDGNRGVDELVTSVTIGSTGTTTVSVGNTATTTVNLGGAATTALTVTGTPTLTDDITIDPNSSTTNYKENAAVRNQFIGLPKISLASTSGVMTNGETNASEIMDDTPTGECAPVTTGAEALDTTNVVTGTNSYKYTFVAAPADNVGFDCDIATGVAGNGADSIGFWFRSDSAFISGDLDASLDDGGSVEGTVVLPAYATVNEWVWMELDLVAQCDADCAAVDGFLLLLTAQSAASGTLDGAVINMDSGAYWIDTGEEAIGDVLVDGVLSVMAVVDAQDQVNAPTLLVEWTDYFVNYQTGADAIVTITDQSANSAFILQALQ